MYLMDEHAERDVSSSGSEAYKCSEAILSFREGSIVNLRNIQIIAYAHLNSTEFSKNQGMCSLQTQISSFTFHVLNFRIIKLNNKLSL